MNEFYNLFQLYLTVYNDNINNVHMHNFEIYYLHIY